MAAFEPRWWEPLALADPHRFCSASCRSFISAIIIWTSASATVENFTAASLNDAPTSHFTGAAEPGRRRRSIIAGCFIANEADARKVDFGRETNNRSFVMSHDKIEPMIWERF